MMGSPHLKNSVYLGLGSNLGDRLYHLNKACEKLEETGVNILKSSQIYETEPWPKHHVPEGRVSTDSSQYYLNQVLQVRTDLSPTTLLQVTQTVQKEMGRVNQKAWVPREIDIDILIYNDQLIDLPELKIPHPFMLDRHFVLIPLLEISPDLRDPKSGLPLQTFLATIQNDHLVKLYHPHL